MVGGGQPLEHAGRAVLLSVAVLDHVLVDRRYVAPTTDDRRVDDVGHEEPPCTVLEFAWYAVVDADVEFCASHAS